MGNLSNFDPRSVPASQYDPLVGEFSFGVLDAEVESMDADRKVLKLQLQVTSAENNGRIQFDRIWLKHPNEKAQEIGHQRLSQLLFAARCPDADDTSELIGRTVRAVCGPQKNKPEYGEVKRYIVPTAPEPQQPKVDLMAEGNEVF